jgi:guanylate kinase
VSVILQPDFRAFIFSAPSGAGKTTIVRRLQQELPFLGFSISATTRQPRPGEIHGKDYYFLDHETFQQKLREDAFLEWEEVYPNYYYGTLKSEVERIAKEQKYPCFDVDVKGGLRLKRYFQDQALAFFIMPPSIEILKERLVKRNTESSEQIKIRLAKAEYELSFAPQFDVQVVNDEIDRAVNACKVHIFRFIEDAAYVKRLKMGL